jgi:hypothetical protein
MVISPAEERSPRDTVLERSRVKSLCEERGESEYPACRAPSSRERISSAGCEWPERVMVMLPRSRASCSYSRARDEIDPRSPSRRLLMPG